MQDLLCLRQVVPFDDRRPLRVPGFDLAGPLLQSATHEADFVVFFLLLLRFEGYHVVLSFADVSPAVQRADEAAGGPAPSWSSSFARHARYHGVLLSGQSRLPQLRLWPFFIVLLPLMSFVETGATGKRRRTALERAAVGSLDIRQCLLRSSSMPRTTASSSLSLCQETALLEASKPALILAADVWRDMPTSATPLLVQANLNLLPAAFCAAFDLPSDAAAHLGNVGDLVVAVRGALHAALCWLDGQEQVLRATPSASTAIRPPGEVQTQLAEAAAALAALRGSGGQSVRDLESLEFPDAALKELYPDLVAEWEIVGKLQSVPWQWVCSVELSLAGFLAPTACLYPVQSIAIYPLTWMFLLHPGSTQTSGLLRLYQDAFDEIERLVNQERAAASADWKASHPAPAANEKNPYEGRLNFSLGSGKRWFSWLSAEGTLNETIVTELYERAKWRRVTLNGDRSFVIMFPYFAVAGAVHLPDIAFLFAGEDALGIRGRARFMYTRQVFLGGCDCCGCCLLRRCMLLLAVVRPASACCAQALFQACRRASRSQRAPPIHAAHSPAFLPQDVFDHVKGYPMRPYTLHPEAVRIFDETFDHHVAAQERHYLSEHSLAKLHGKKKTSNLRIALQVHLLDQARQGRAGRDWASSVPATALQFANAFGDYLDAVSDSLDSYFAALLPASSGPPAPGSQSSLAKFRSLADSSIDDLCGLSEAVRAVLSRLLRVLLKFPAAWVTGSALRADREFKGILEGAGVARDAWDEHLCRLGALLKYTRLGNFFLSTNVSGPRTFYFVRRTFAATDPFFLQYSNILQAVGITNEALRGHTLDRLLSQRAKTAPEPQFPNLATAAEGASVLQRMTQFIVAAR
ncbi:unnamed protein product [Symbiodinium microadriaticum]|nr:unnamed protein product [Symbiodinium sp. KB8]CAE7885064.1 unnamed protein product [Symbiodinium microadriaticum]